MQIQYFIAFVWSSLIGENQKLRCKYNPSPELKQHDKTEKTAQAKSPFYIFALNFQSIEFPNIELSGLWF